MLNVSFVHLKLIDIGYPIVLFAGFLKGNNSLKLKINKKCFLLQS